MKFRTHLSCSFALKRCTCIHYTGEFGKGRHFTRPSPRGAKFKVQVQVFGRVCALRNSTRYKIFLHCSLSVKLFCIDGIVLYTVYTFQLMEASSYDSSIAGRILRESSLLRIVRFWTILIGYTSCTFIYHATSRA